MSPMVDLESWLARLDRVEARLAALATPAEGLTEADPSTGEQWEAGQVWGHIAEFIQFWVEQAGDVVDAYQGEPVPFGRIRSDPTRLAGIELGRHAAIETMWQEVQADLGDVRRFLGALPEHWSDSVGLHPTLGPIPTDRILETFLIDHLEEHATQLEGLAKSQAPNEG
jgi:hypothetical protein